MSDKDIYYLPKNPISFNGRKVRCFVPKEALPPELSQIRKSIRERLWVDEGKDVFKINKSKILVGETQSDLVKKLIRNNHYTRSIKASSLKFAILYFRKPEHITYFLEDKYPENIEDDYKVLPRLIGAAIFAPPTASRLHKSIGDFIQSQNEVLELKRYFIGSHHLALGRNTETWCLAQILRKIEQNHPRYKCLVSYSDPHAGHSGSIYRAANFYLNMPGDLFANSFVYSEDRIKWSVPRSMSRDKIPQDLVGLENYCKNKFKGKEFWIKRHCNKVRYLHFFGNKTTKKNYLSRLKYPVLSYDEIESLMRYFEDNKFLKRYQF